MEIETYLRGSAIIRQLQNPYSLIIGESKQFKIPVFQRDYSWTTGAVLVSYGKDVMSASSEDSGGHFMGSFVYIEESPAGAVFNRLASN